MEKGVLFIGIRSMCDIPGWLREGSYIPIFEVVDISKQVEGGDGSFVFLF